MARRFIPPPLIAPKGITFFGCRSYTEYNYLKPGLASYLKRWHFEVALEWTKNYFHKCNVIDFGCCEGPFIPSLSSNFNWVVGVDNNERFTSMAKLMVEILGLKNVDIINNSTLPFNEIRSQISERRYQVVFLLEILEHIGKTYKTMYQDKKEFLQNVSTLVDDEGIIVISVPNMIGLWFFLQRFGLQLFRLSEEKLSSIEIIRASFFNNTSYIETLWKNGHIGFNHKIFERDLKENFIIVKKIVAFQVMYMLRKKKNALIENY